MNTSDRTWVSKTAQDHDGASFVHPGDLIDAASTFDDEHSKEEGIDTFKRLLFMCLPRKAHGINRELVGYHRMCVLI